MRKRVEDLLDELPSLLDEHDETLRDGSTLAALSGTSEKELELLYAHAYREFNAGNYQLALQAGIVLASSNPVDPRFHFLTARCLQQLGTCDVAARFYAYALALDEQHVGSAFRMAECLDALGEEELARQAFESVVDMGRSEEGSRALVRHAEERLAAMS